VFTTAYLDLAPLEEAGGTVALPGSKSISNRVLLLAACPPAPPSSTTCWIRMTRG
jgi:5-enolpyruvylshikimate-3-phosphate synthase